MFDIEKAKSRGLDPAQIEIMQKINENSFKRDNCKKHDFVQMQKIAVVKRMQNLYQAIDKA